MDRLQHHLLLPTTNPGGMTDRQLKITTTVISSFLKFYSKLSAKYQQHAVHTSFCSSCHSVSLTNRLPSTNVGTVLLGECPNNDMLAAASVYMPQYHNIYSPTFIHSFIHSYSQSYSHLYMYLVQPHQFNHITGADQNQSITLIVMRL